MVTISIRYTGDLHCDAVHGPSGAIISTDAPVDNHGRGESFSPTDLFATALGTCVVTIMGIQARTLGVSIEGTTAEVEKEMAVNGPRRVGRLGVVITVPGRLEERYRKALERAAAQCPVHRSLHPDVEVDLRFVWK